MTACPTVPRDPSPAFIFLCWDGPDAAGPRAEHLDGHLAHVEANWERYVVAGPMREPGGEELIGSTFIVLAETPEDAWDLMNGDPYVTCGMYDAIDIRELTLSIGQFMGGKIWPSADAIRHRAAGGPSRG